jgi:drug/metabolite transporter (DMT)-like permease
MTAGASSRSSRDTRLAVAALAGQSIFLGYNWVVMKVGLRYSDPWPFVALRTGLGAIALFILLAILRKPLRPRQPLTTMLLGLLQTTAMIGLLMWALQTGAAGRVSALVYTMPVWTLMLGWIFLGERVVGLQWLSALLGLAGLVLVLDPLHLGGTWQSKLLAIAAGMAWAASAILVKRINKRQSVDVINLTAWQMLYGSVPLIVIALLVPSHSIEWSGSFIAALAYNVIPATAISWVLWLFILKALPAGVAGISTLATPVIGIASAAIQLGERVSPMEAAGMGCILAALLVLVLRGLHRRNFGGARQRGTEERVGDGAVAPATEAGEGGEG